MTTSFATKLREIIRDSARRARKQNTKADVKFLLNHGVHTMQALIDLTQNPRAKSDLRSVACWVLGQMNDPRAVPVLLDLVESAGPQVSWEAAKALVVLLGTGNKKTLRLKQTLLHGRSPQNRAAAAYVLGLTGNSSSVPSLIKVMNGNDAGVVRSHAAEALGNIRVEQACKALILALSDRSSEVRFSAAYALGEVGDQLAIPALKKLARDQSNRSSKLRSIDTQAMSSIRKIQQRNRSRLRETKRTVE